MVKKYKAKLVEFGNGGHTENYGRHHRCSGYDRPHNWRISKDTDYSDCIFLDKIPAIATDEGYKWVFSGPLVDVDLKDGECNELGEVSEILEMAMDGNAYGNLLKLHNAQKAKSDDVEKAKKLKTKKRGALDQVSRKEYVLGWLERGARIGRLVNGELVWED